MLRQQAETGQDVGPMLLCPKLPPHPLVVGSCPFDPAWPQASGQGDCHDSCVPLEENPNQVEKAKSTWL